MQKAIIQLEALSCPSCMQKIEGALKALPGVIQENVKVLFNVNKVRVDFDSETISVVEIKKGIEDLGYPVTEITVKGV